MYIIKNEIIAIIANHVIRDLVSEIRGGFFSIICDEYTDISNKEQLTICIRWVDKELEAHEDFLGFYNVPDIGAETIVSAIKDVLLKLQLSLVNCRGQCYDGACNMMGLKTGVTKRIQDLQPKAYPTHCHGHSFSLRWPNTVFKCLCLIHHYFQTIYALAPVFCKSQGYPQKYLFSHLGKGVCCCHGNGAG